MITGDLRKMEVRLSDPVDYYLPLDDERLHLNPLLGKELQLRYEGEIHCTACGRATKKSFQSGYCYPCSQRLAECDICIVRPEKCHYAAGTCRQPEWGEAHCMQQHYVYLANSSGLKVGITRGTQVPIRWIDQGASQAMPILRVSTRLISGLVETAIAEHVNDKTDWRRMLKGQPDAIDLPAERDRLLGLVAETLAELRAAHGEEAVVELPEAEVTDIQFPVLEYPAKVKSLNLDKTPEVGGVLQGIKGQYLIFDSGVINMRKYAGYRLSAMVD